MYKILYMIGLAGSIITAFTTVFLFFKCGVIEVSKDLMGFKNKNSKIKGKLAMNTDLKLGKGKISSKSKIKVNGRTITGETVNRQAEIEETTFGIKRNTDMVNIHMTVNPKSIEEVAVSNILIDETCLVDDMEDIDEETNLLDEETGLVDEETGLLDEETGLFEEELADGEYIEEINIVIVNYKGELNLKV